MLRYAIFCAEHSREEMSEKTHEVLTIREIAKLLKLAANTVYSMARRGELAMFKVRGQWRVHRTDFDEWMAQQRRQADLTDGRDPEGGGRG